MDDSENDVRKQSAEESGLRYYRSNDKDHPDTARWLRRIQRGSTTLCFPSGTQTWGDLKADVDPEVRPDLFADLFNPPFKSRSFDTVYCDPPYSFCAYDKVHGWLPEVWDITNLRLIVMMPAVEYNLPDSQYQLIHERNKTGTMHLPLYHIWDRQTGKISDWNEGNGQRVGTGE